jgi:peptidyl-prolyl cis-trans isomerase-like protein 2
LLTSFPLGTDKLYITHSEWSSEDQFSANSGAGVSRAKSGLGAHGSFKRLPFNFCALSLQPFDHPVCTAQGVTFDIERVAKWLETHSTNPVDGQPLKASDLIKLNFAKNDDGEYVDPVTYKVFTDNTHIVALRNTGNVFAWDTIQRLNIKAKNWRDLVNDEEFSRNDIITLQDPQNIESRNLSSFKYLKDGESTLTAEEEAARQNPLNNLNASALGSTAKVLKAKEAVARARAEREKEAEAKRNAAQKGAVVTKNGSAVKSAQGLSQGAKPKPYNAAKHTTGKAAASFTSTGLTPHTGGERALLSDEEFMLKPRRVKVTGYARMDTNHGELNLELYPEFAPKAVWNFVQLAKKGYYNGLVFHRNIRNFMIQGGDPTGTGRGGNSTWGKNFEDEFEGPLTHDARGMLSMANKGKNTNSSQFFITYRATKHLDRKHTIFGRVVGGLDTLTRLENVKGDDKDRPLDDIELREMTILLDPFEEFLKQRAQKEAEDLEKEQIQKSGGTEDDKITWTGKRIRGDGTFGSDVPGVGKYLKTTAGEGEEPKRTTAVQPEDDIFEPPKKKTKAAGFGNFDAW